MEKTVNALKKIRLGKGVTLEEVHKKTKIYLNILKAIEGDAITDINPIYLKSFIKIYCKYLGVDPDEHIPAIKEKQPVPAQVLAKKEPVAPESKKSKLSLSDAPHEVETLRPPKDLVKFIIFAVVAAALLFVLFKMGGCIAYRIKNRPVQVKVAKPVVAPVKENKAVLAQKLPAVSSVPAKSQKEAVASEIRLSIYARERCWVELKVDGKMFFRGRLEKGRTEAWKAKDKMELTLGDAGAVDVQVNDQNFRNLGRKGQPRKNIIITKEGLR